MLSLFESLPISVCSVGRFLFHTPCCARQDGRRPTVTFHQCHPNDPIFHQLPSLKLKPVQRAKMRNLKKQEDKENDMLDGQEDEMSISEVSQFMLLNSLA